MERPKEILNRNLQAAKITSLTMHISAYNAALKAVEEAYAVSQNINTIATYTLRNQDKIENKYGTDFLKNLRESLNDFFAKSEAIEEHNIKGDPYKSIRVPDFAKNNGAFWEFYVVKITAEKDLILAFKAPPNTENKT